MRVPKVIRIFLLQQIACAFLISKEYNDSLILEDFLITYNDKIKNQSQEFSELVVQLEKMI